MWLFAPSNGWVFHAGPSKARRSLAPPSPQCDPRTCRRMQPGCGRGLPGDCSSRGASRLGAPRPKLHTWPAVRRRGPLSACDGPRRQADGRGAPRPRRGAAWRLGATRPALPTLIADRADAATRRTGPRGHAHGSPSSGAGPGASGENARRRLGQDSENAARSAARRGLRAQPRIRAGRAETSEPSNSDICIMIVYNAHVYPQCHDSLARLACSLNGPPSLPPSSEAYCLPAHLSPPCISTPPPLLLNSALLALSSPCFPRKSLPSFFAEANLLAPCHSTPPNHFTFPSCHPQQAPIILPPSPRPLLSLPPSSVPPSSFLTRGLHSPRPPPARRGPLSGEFTEERVSREWK